MRERVEQLVALQPTEGRSDVRILDLDIGEKGVGLFTTTEEMVDQAGMVSAEKLYGAAAGFAQSLAGVPFASTQVGNIKYKIPVQPGSVLIVKGRIVLMRGNKKHIYISFFRGDLEVYRAKFIMEISGQMEASPWIK
jgi:hypothetical protein